MVTINDNSKGNSYMCVNMRYKLCTINVISNGYDKRCNNSKNSSAVNNALNPTIFGVL